MERSMTITVFSFMQVTTILLTGLLAGLFYGYDCSVINGLGKLTDREYLNAFQSINKEILNPYFFLSFMGSLLALPVVAWLSYKESNSALFYCLVSATVVYVLGVFCVTVFGNVPLNNLVEQFDVTSASTESIQAMRVKFERNWNALHHIRTYAAMLAFLLTILSTKFK